MAKILSIEDCIETQIIIKRVLETCYDLTISYNLKSARQFINQNDYDLILLDLVLPDGEGLQFFKELSFSNSASQVPVIILSGLSDVDTKVKGFEFGADDYITKPFEYSELKARIASVLRRGPTRHHDTTISILNLELDLIKQTVFHKCANIVYEISMTPIEFKILTTFCRSFETFISREELKLLVWGNTYISLRNIDTHVCNLRKKLSSTKIEIYNKRNLGYIARINNSHLNNHFDNTSGSDDSLILPCR